MFGVSPGEEIEPAAEMPAERCSVSPPDPYTSCTDFEFSSVSPDLEPIHEILDYFRINRRMFVTPRQLFPDDNEDDSDACNGCIQLKEEYEILAEVHIEVKRALEDAQQERELKSRECDAALASLNKLQIELMQMSMRVGSLAFAMDKHKKDKKQWLRSLDTLSMKFRLLKMENAKLSEEASQYKRSLADLTQMTNTIISTLDPHVDKLEFIEEVTEQKDIYNNLVELNGNIRVFCRCRPLNKREIDGGASLAIDFESAKDDEIFVKAPRKVFKFDGVFGPEKEQESVFEKISPLATSVLDGYNICIFAYGQTGSGKTFTMEEVYNEHIRDLLLPGSETGGAAKRLEVRQAAEGLHHVPGLVEAEVTNMDEAWEILQTGNKARVVGSTKANEQSSRSHCIHCVIVKGENLTNGERTRSRLWLVDLAGSERLVDLAGSERVTKMDVKGERLKEAQNINRSLSALVDVISALANKSSHIPFRNSKLSRILQDSLVGKSKTLMLVQISPTKKDVAETLCSLNFASRVRGVKLGTAKKQIDQSEIYRCKKMVGNPQLPQLNIKNKDIQLKTLEETAPSLVLKNKLEELSYKILQEKMEKEIRRPPLGKCQRPTMLYRH